MPDATHHASCAPDTTAPPRKKPSRTSSTSSSVPTSPRPTIWRPPTKPSKLLARAHALLTRLLPRTRRARRPPITHFLLLPAVLLLLFELRRRASSPPPARLHPVAHARAPPTSPPLLPPARVRASPFGRRPLPGVALIACCMNRHAALKQVLPGWLRVRNVSEIIIVDWASSPPLDTVVLPMVNVDNRVRLLRVENESAWVLTRAYNLAVSSAASRTILRADCDYDVRERFVQRHPLTRGVFYAGNYARARDDNEVHLNGAVLVRRDDFQRVGGYDERIQTYGWDDEDLYTRLQKAGLRKLNMSYDLVRHVRHGDAARAQRDVSFVQVEIDLNALLLRRLGDWSARLATRGQWAVLEADVRFARLRAHRKPQCLKQLVSPDVLRQSWDLALGQRLANDYRVPWDIMASMRTRHKRLLLKRLNGRQAHPTAVRKSARILFVHCMHGLGNRLRALASAMSFANASGRELVVIWERDGHNSASFDHLFDDDVIVLNEFKPKWPLDGYVKYDQSWSQFRFYNYMEMEKGAVKGKHIVDEDLHLYVKTAYILEADAALTNWKADNAMLRSLTPVKEVQAIVKRHEAHGLHRMVGVHIRDRTLQNDIKNMDFDSEYGKSASREMDFWRRKSAYGNFASEMRKLISQDAHVKFYVATDTVALFQHLRHDFADRIVVTQRDCDGRDSRCVRFALVDLLCLGRTRLLLGSNWSSFTEIASRFGGLAPRLAGRDFAADKS